MIKSKITIKDLKDYFKKDLKVKPKHDLKSCKYAFNKLNKEIKIDVLDLVYLIFQNKPIDKLITHSYGFHTSNGRYLIDTFSNYYNFKTDQETI